MNNSPTSLNPTPRNTIETIRASMSRRHWAEKRFRWYGLTAIFIALFFLSLMFISIISQGYTAFVQTYIQLDIYFDPAIIDPQGTRDPEVLSKADYTMLYRQSLKTLFPDVTGRNDTRTLNGLISSGAGFDLRQKVMKKPDLIGTTQPIWLLADDVVDTFAKGNIRRDIPEDQRPFKDKEIRWVDQLVQDGRLKKSFNTVLFTQGDSREPELAGILGGVSGSFFTLLITLLLSFPIGVAAAVYLEEFAPKNTWTDIIEVNINNLAAVPSIVFGLLGLAVFIQFFGVPRSTPVVGGLVLTLMTLPTIIIAGRAALKSVPPSIREAALGMGASKMQMVAHHVLPLAMPGMLTGSIIGMAQALGETAPLLLIGMVAFVADVPTQPLDTATVVPVQIYMWSDLPERAFVERTSAAIMILLAFLIAMNATAVILRKQFERRW